MTQRIVNAAASPITAQDKTDLQAALVTLAANPNPTFAEIRAVLPAGRRARATDGMIHQAALDLGLKVEL